MIMPFQIRAWFERQSSASSYIEPLLDKNGRRLGNWSDVEEARKLGQACRVAAEASGYRVCVERVGVAGDECYIKDVLGIVRSSVFADEEAAWIDLCLKNRTLTAYSACLLANALAHLEAYEFT